MTNQSQGCLALVSLLGGLLWTLALFPGCGRSGSRVPEGLSGGSPGGGSSGSAGGTTAFSGSDGIAGTTTTGSVTGGHSLAGGTTATSTNPLDADGGIGPSCRQLSPCTATEVMTSNGSTTVTSYVYDANQRLIREDSTYGADGSPKVSVFYTYDEHGWLLESKSSDCDSPAGACRWFIYTYDSAGRVLKEEDRSQYSGRAPGCTNNTYDQDGRLVRKVFDPFCKDGSGDATLYEYDSQGRLISEHIDRGGKTVSLTSYAYDAAGFVLSATHRNSSDTVDEVVVFTRDAAGNPLVEEHQMKNELIDDYTVFRAFDGMGHQLDERTRHSEGAEAGIDMWCWVRTFDSCGNRLTEMRWSSRCDQPSYSRTTLSYDCR